MTKNGRKVEVIAHRGASGTHPENTLAAIKQAINLGVDWIEIDVRQTLDRVLIVIHDETLSRTTSGRGRIISKNYSTIKQHDAGSWFSPEFKDEKIPSLNEVLNLVEKSNCKLLIELKGTLLAQPKLASNIISMLEKHAMKERVLLQSFNSEVLRALQKEDPTVALNNLINYHSRSMPFYIDRIPKLGNIYRVKYTEGINPNYKKVTEKMVAKVHESGKKMYCWTVDNPSHMEQLIELGVDGIITNYPERLLALLNNEVV
jgi:glycerophosphoryl diester phosphodiesterase